MSFGLTRQTGVEVDNPDISILLDKLKSGHEERVSPYSSLSSLLERDEATPEQLISCGICDVLLSSLADSNIDAMEFVAILYKKSTPEDRLVFADCGIPDTLLNKLNADDPNLILHSLSVLRNILLIDITEHERIYESEIWPSLSSLYNNYADDVDLLVLATIVLNGLLDPSQGSSHEISKMAEIIDSILHVEEYYMDILPLESENLDYSEHEDWSLYLRLLAPIEVFLADGVSDSSFFDSTISLYLDRIIPVLLQGIERLQSAAALKALSMLVVCSKEVCHTLLENNLLLILDGIEFDENHCDDLNRFKMWCVVNMLGSIAAGSEDDVEMILTSTLWEKIVRIMQSERLYFGLISEFVYLVSNLVFSATSEQKQRIANSGCVFVLNSMMKSSKDEQLCNLAAGSLSLLTDDQIDVDLYDSAVLGHPDECAEELIPYPFDIFEDSMM
ncbi:hypothetical protein WA171_007117 [Blastocystis sp. BT1]